MKIFHRKASANFPQTSTWGITATRFAVVIALGLHDVVIELPQRKLTRRVPDVKPACPTCKDTGSVEYPCPNCRSSKTASRG